MNIVWIITTLLVCLSVSVKCFVLQDSGISTNLDIARIKADVRRQKNVTDQLIQLAVNGSAKGQLYNRLADFVDRYGSRISGSQNLENSIEYIKLKMKEDKLENVYGDIVEVPHWERGEESAYMMKPRYKKLTMLGLGTSIATPPGGIHAEVLVVKTFEELERRASDAVGKIIVFNQDWVSYGVSGRYRFYGAARAAAVGGVASLIRSVTPFSINSPHTGSQVYNESIKKIPTACITVEDAEMMWRMSQRGERIEIFLNMSAKNFPKTLSRNVISEIVGSTYPDEVVLISGHIDSWDVGQGAMDDGAGALLGWQVLSMILQLGSRPKRTIRSIMWTAEEFGFYGSRDYFKRHKNDSFVFVSESDMGTFKPKGLTFGGNQDAVEVMKEVMGLLSIINATSLVTSSTDTFDGGEVTPWVRLGVPGAMLETYNEKYFYFHHSEGDTMEVLDSDDLDLCSAVWAVMAYTVANIEDSLPRDFV
ncbi:hypothetical protein ACF0H5_002271 [Mactra antiquata]